MFHTEYIRYSLHSFFNSFLFLMRKFIFVFCHIKNRRMSFNFFYMNRRNSFSNRYNVTKLINKWRWIKYCPIPVSNSFELLSTSLIISNIIKQFRRFREARKHCHCENSNTKRNNSLKFSISSSKNIVNSY